MVRLLRKVARSRKFRLITTSVIAGSGLLVGLETNESIVSSAPELFEALEHLIVAFFLVELTIRIAAYGSKPWRFFRNGWNVFDFVIITLCALPLAPQPIPWNRVARVLRMLRLVTALPRLRLLVRALVSTIPSIGYVSMLLMLHFYIYAVVGTFLFGKNDPVHFGSLHIALVSLFRVLTLEDWTDLMYIQMYGSAKYGYDIYPEAALVAQSTAFPVVSVLFFISFVLLGTMIILNLFVGVMLNSIAETTTEAEVKDLEASREKGYLTVADELKLLYRQIDGLKSNVQTLSVRLKHEKAAELREDEEAVALSAAKASAAHQKVANLH
ncbi:MAG: ion transporter [Bdellovibrionales bacterium]|nr:ion transporter [Bdellovibrionales bacterium]